MSGEASTLPVVREIDAMLAGSTGLDERLVQRLIDRGNGTGSCTISWVRTPAGGGSPEGLHVHSVDQIFYIVSGTMTVEVRSERFTAEAGAVVLFPARVPHRNWNAGPGPTIHLAINVPAPDPDVPFAQPAESGSG